MATRNSYLPDGGEEMGMTDMQFKAYLLEQLENWKNVLKLAQEANDTKVVEEADKQVAKIMTALNI